MSPGATSITKQATELPKVDLMMPTRSQVSEEKAFEFLEGMGRTRSHSGEEAKVAAYIVEQMKGFGYQSRIDSAGNAVGTRCGTAIPGKPWIDVTGVQTWALSIRWEEHS